MHHYYLESSKEVPYFYFTNISQQCSKCGKTREKTVKGHFAEDIMNFEKHKQRKR